MFTTVMKRIDKQLQFWDREGEAFVDTFVVLGSSIFTQGILHNEVMSRPPWHGQDIQHQLQRL